MFAEKSNFSDKNDEPLKIRLSSLLKLNDNKKNSLNLAALIRNSIKKGDENDLNKNAKVRENNEDEGRENNGKIENIEFFVLLSKKKIILFMSYIIDYYLVIIKKHDDSVNDLFLKN